MGTRMYVGIKANYYVLNLAALRYLSQALDSPFRENLSLSLSLSLPWLSETELLSPTNDTFISP